MSARLTCRYPAAIKEPGRHISAFDIMCLADRATRENVTERINRILSTVEPIEVYVTKKINERDVEKPCVAYARAQGVLVVKQTHAGARSFPDRGFYFSNGHLLQIEFKAPGKLPTSQQAHTIADLRARGFDVQVVDNKALGIDLIKDRMSRNKVAYHDYNAITKAALYKVLDIHTA